MPLIPELWRYRHENQKFRVILHYVASLRLVCETRDPFSKETSVIPISLKDLCVSVSYCSIAFKKHHHQDNSY